MTDILDFTLERGQNIYGSFYEMQKIGRKKSSTKQVLLQQYLERLLKYNHVMYIKRHDNYYFSLNQRDYHGNFQLKKNIQLNAEICIKPYFAEIKLHCLDFCGNKIHARYVQQKISLCRRIACWANSKQLHFKIQYNPIIGCLFASYRVNFTLLTRDQLTQMFYYTMNIFQKQTQIMRIFQIFSNSSRQMHPSLNTLHLKRWVLQNQYLNHVQLKKKTFCSEISENTTIRDRKELRKFLLELHRILQGTNWKIFEESLLNRKIFLKKVKQFRNTFKPQNIMQATVGNDGVVNLRRLKTEKTSSLQAFIQKYNIDPIVSENQLEIKLIRTKKSKKSTKQSSSSAFYQEKLVNLQEQLKNTQILELKDENQNTYLVKCIKFTIEQVQKELLISQNLCREGSFTFLNYYIKVENYKIADSGYLLLDLNPKRTQMVDFLQKNALILSFESKLKIGANLMQSLLGFIEKNKIKNYFPSLSLDNLEISASLAINFKFLSLLCHNPFLQILNVLIKIFFGKRDLYYKQSTCCYSCNHFANDVYVPSFAANLIKYLLCSFLSELNHIKLLERQVQNKNLGIETKLNIQTWKKSFLKKMCQSFLVLFQELLKQLSTTYKNQ